jgi:fatty acid-binding protein DegV
MVPEAAAELAAAAEAAHPDALVFTGPFSTAMIVHTGPGVLGVAWWWEPAQKADP